MGLVYLFLLSVIVQFASAQRLANSLTDQFNNYQEKHYQEKVYLHTDRDFYVAGEIVWFSVYCTAASNNRFSEISKVVYVELIDSDNKAIIQEKIKLEHGQGAGSFYLPVSLKNAQYTLRAYTRWMRNASEDFFFRKPLSIVNTFVGSVASGKSQQDQYDVQFLPEGGQLLANFKNHVGFKAIDQSGRGVSVAGVLLSQEGDTLQSFNDTHLGMGSFYFTPKASEDYQALLVINGNVIKKSLPKVTEQGYLLQVGSTNQLLNIKAITNYNEPSLTFFIHHKGEVLKSVSKKIQANSAEIQIPLDSLHTGIYHITLFNSYEKPVAERLYFHIGDLPEMVDVKLSQKILSTRQKLDLAIVNTQNATTRFSLSVFQNDALSVENTMSINSWLLLQSDLSGYIENPQYYFTAPKNEAKEAVDVLMLTQGWRRFKWEELQNPIQRENVIFPELEGPILEVEITDKETGEAGNWVETYLSFPGKNFRFFAQKSNTKGRLNYILRDIGGIQQGILRGFTQQDSTWKFKVLSPFVSNETENVLPPLQLDKTWQNDLIQRSISMQAQNIYFKEELNQFTALQFDTIPFYGTPDQRYLLDDYTRFPTMEEVMREYVPKVAVRKSKGLYRYKVFNSLGDIYFNTDPLILLDGMPILNTNDVLAFDPFKIKSLDIVSREFVTNKVSFSGLVSYRTYNGDYTWQPPHEEDFVFEYNGLQEERTFYQPAYQVSASTLGKMPDFRTLLFWQPSIIINPQQRHNLSFYTSDNEGSFKGVLQGLSAEGTPIFYQFNFDVKGASN